MYENNLRTGTGYEYNSNLENMVVKKAEPQEQKVDFKVLEALLNQGTKELYELPKESLIELRDMYKNALNNLPEKLPTEKQSPLEIETREDYQEICKELKKRELI